MWFQLLHCVKFFHQISLVRFNSVCWSVKNKSSLLTSMRSMYSAGDWVSFLESGWLGVISTNPVSFYWTNIPLVIKISLLIFIWQTFILFQNKRWKKVYNLLSLLLLTFSTTNILFSAFETIMSSGVIETQSIFAEATNCNLKIVDW